MRPPGGLAAAALVALGLLAAPARARAQDRDPSTETLLIVGAGAAVPSYVLGVALHEGSHALAAKAFGAEVTEVRITPGRKGGRFHFGYTSWRGRLSRGQMTVALLAPKVTNLLFLGGYAALVGFDALPSDEAASLAVTVFATAQWVDLTKSLAWNPGEDVNRVYAMHGLDFWEALPFRLTHLTLSVATAFLLARGYEEVFDGRAAPKILAPLAAGAF